MTITKEDERLYEAIRQDMRKRLPNYQEGYIAGVDLALGDLMPECAGAPCLVAAAAGLAVALTAAERLAGDEVRARQAVRSALLAYWRDNIDEHADDDVLPTEITMEAARKADALADWLCKNCDWRSDAAVFWGGLSLAMEAVAPGSIVKGQRRRRRPQTLGRLLFLLERLAFDQHAPQVN